MMIQKLIGIVKNRTKVGGINFLIELLIGVLSEWQRANRDGTLDFNQKSETLNDVQEHQKFNANEYKH